MKATIEKLDTTIRPLWKGEALCINWNNNKGEFVISGRASDKAQNAIQKCVKDRIRMAIGIEDVGSTQIVWRGYVSSADFHESGVDQTECCLAMFLDDWWGVSPGFSSCYPS
ncbi:MAG: hypothetical protein JSV02_02005 [Dehalococcoidia bacterium]|nr:MAG: hypothetical protein JSV02_02005 [Dehalococcoidia bacterium]